MKKYIAKTNVSINVVLSTGANRHIAFSALTGGGSVFYTDDPDIIQAMECHYKFGTLFRVDPRYVAEKQRNKPTSPTQKPEIIPEQPTAATANTPAAVEDVADAPTIEAAETAPIVEQSTTNEDVEAEDSEAEDSEAEDAADDSGPKTIVVSDPDAAKAYLAEQFGISRTKIKSIKAIKEAAAAHGIVFDGI